MDHPVDGVESNSEDEKGYEAYRYLDLLSVTCHTNLRLSELIKSHGKYIPGKISEVYDFVSLEELSHATK